MTIGLDAQLEPNIETMPCDFFPWNFCLEVYKDKTNIFFYSFAQISYWFLGLFTHFNGESLSKFHFTCNIWIT